MSPNRKHSASPFDKPWYERGELVVKRRRHARREEPVEDKFVPDGDEVNPFDVDAEGAPIYLTVKDSAELLRTTPRAIYSMIHRGQLPGVRRLGRRILVSREELVDWIEACKQVVAAP